MKTFSKLCAVGALIIKSWILGGLLFGAEIDRYGVESNPGAETKKPPGANQKAELFQPPDSASPAMADDLRPVIRVDTLHDGLSRTDPKHHVLCQPCDEFDEWHATYKDLFPLKFDVRRHPNVNRIPRDILDLGTPVLRFQGADGGFYFPTDVTGKNAGWPGPEKLLAAYKSKNPEFGKAVAMMMAAAPVGPKSDDALVMFTKLAGPGRFAWTPDKPVAAYVDETTFLQYSKLAGTVKLANGQPVVVLDDPKPQVTKLMWGMIWVKVSLLEVDGELPKSVVIRHTKGKLRVNIEEVK